MAQHETHKRTRDGRRATLERKARRMTKYATRELSMDMLAPAAVRIAR